MPPNLTQNNLSPLIRRCSLGSGHIGHERHGQGTHRPRDASSKGRIVQGTHRPRDTSSKVRVVQGTLRPRETSSKGNIVPGTHRPRDTSSSYASSKGRFVQGTIHPRDALSKGRKVRDFSFGTHRSGILHQLDVLILQKPDSALSRMKKNDTFHKKGLLNLLIEYVNMHLCP
jgi:hypothetical protein